MPTESWPSAAENDPVLAHVSRAIRVISVMPLISPMQRGQKSAHRRLTMRACGDGKATATGMPDSFASILAI
jgi:hypothetical protein